jgi:uncharacterized protein YjiS (DUF1127 family)
MSLSKNSYLTTHSHDDVASWLSSPRSIVDRVHAAWTARRTRTRELRELSLFSDRELWDVGLSRSDILSIEQGVYRRD